MKLDYKMVGKRIQKQRKKCRLTQEQLAELTNRSPAFISHIERGTRKMSLETLCELSLALKCPTDELLGIKLYKTESYASARELLALAHALAKAEEQEYSKLEEDEDKLFERLSKASDQVQRIDRKQQTSNLKKAERRKADVDKLFAKLYEDWSAGRISDYNFNMLSEKYQKEQLELEAKIGKLQEALNTVSEAVTNAGKWITLLKESARPKELTAQLLNKLIDAIYIGEAIKRADGSRDQEIRISYRFVGRID